MITVYNSLNPSNYIMLTIAFITCLAFIVISAFFIFNLVKSKANFFKYFIQYSFFGIVLIVGLYVSILLSANVYYNIKYVLIPYSQGQYKEISGTVENYKSVADDRDVYFDINGTEFHIGNYEIGNIGYQGKAISNGDFLCIKYFAEDENTILKIDKKT